MTYERISLNLMRQSLAILWMEILKMMMKNNSPVNKNTLMNYNRIPIDVKPQNKEI